MDLSSLALLIGSPIYNIAFRISNGFQSKLYIVLQALQDGSHLNGKEEKFALLTFEGML